jgi:hypothetical protein
MRLKEAIKRIPGVRWLARRPGTVPLSPDLLKHGPDGIKEVGHREYVGGMWDEIGRLQFDFLVSQGLRPHHYLLDIACGSLRAGTHFIPYLEPGHYLGVDKEADLIRAGVERELGAELREARRPVLIVDGEFSFDRFGLRPDYALAQSLFSHLTSDRIEKCLRNLRGVIADDGAFYATYIESAERFHNPERSHDAAMFHFTREEMERFGRSTGWRFEYIGDWNHPRQQVIVRYRPA